MPLRFAALRTIVLLLLSAGTGSGLASAAEPVDFNRDVRPILSQHCFKCHGPDPKTREAEMRLDTHDGLFEDRGETTAFMPGDLDKSEAWQRITSDDEFMRMPPPDAKRDLTPAKIAILKAWIEQGAKWEPHWAFVPPQRVALPDVKHTGWARNAVDRFVLARMEAAGLSPSPEADRYTLIRRVSLDLIGLPPSIEETDAFVNDARPDAYERLVDRLLASPHYGERWARRWLDLARYADTNGYEKDRTRSIWPYRDWVIDAINADMPFDEFTVNQLAGDMLPDATTSDLIATGFHRNTMLNEEGGIDPLEFRYHAMTDRVATTGTTWLGLTTGCAQCHDHKFDPISHREYFGLMAFLNNADEPEMPLPDSKRDALYAANLEQADELLRELPSHWPISTDGDWQTARVLEAKTESGETPKVLKDGSVLLVAPGPERDTYTIVVETESPRIDRLRIEALTHRSLPQKGPGRVAHGNFVLSEVSIVTSPRSQPELQTPVTITSAKADIEQDGFAASSAIDGDATTGWAIHSPGKPLNANHEITLTFAKPVENATGSRFVVTLRQEHGSRHTIGRVRIGVPSEQKPAQADPSQLAQQAFEQWLQRERARTVAWTNLRPSEVSANLPLLTVQDDDSVFVTGDTTKQDTYALTFAQPLKPNAANGSGKARDREPITALRLEALPDDRLPARGPGMTYYEGTPGDFFLTEFRVTADGQPVEIVSASDSYSKNRFGNNAATSAQAIDGDMQTGWSVDGRQGERHTAVFVLSQPVDVQKLQIEMTFGRHFASSLGKFRVSATDGTLAVSRGRETAGDDEARPGSIGGESSTIPAARDLEDETERLLAKPDDELTSEEHTQLLNAFLLQAPELEKFAAQIRTLRKPPAATTTLVFRERPASNPRPTFVHNRGEYLQPTEEVEPITLEALHPFPADQPLNRLGFARWLVDEANPLTARVVANRHWAALFGRGVVPTVQDFGFQGEAPSHPELLDWLALELMGSRWDVKALHRAIVTSATYRQASVVNEATLQLDPSNIWLSRGQRLRLEAELIRDAALVSSGLFSRQMHGEPVRPPQPEGVTEAAYGSPKWNASTGNDRYRRSVYTFIKRTAPFAMFSVFDAPSGEACTAKRDVSNTALQSLTMLNDMMFMEAAQAFGRELASLDGSDEARATVAFRRILTRPPTDEERSRLITFLKTQRERFTKDELDAKKFVGTDDATAEQAVWTALARALMSLDEATTRS